MNYSAELLDELAAQYTLGTLRHAARARFERLCNELPAAREAQQRWEDHLLPLALGIVPMVPSTLCWTQIQRLIGLASSVPATKRFRVHWWQGAIAASLVVAALITGRYTIWNEPTWQPVAVLALPNAAPLWRIERSADTHQIHVRTVGAVSLPSSQSYELWVLPAGAGNPVSLGLLPRVGVAEHILNNLQRSRLLAATKVAVSIEPSGGSPTGAPTGPVVIVAVISRPV